MRMYEEGDHRVPERDGMVHRPLFPTARLPTMLCASIALWDGRLPLYIMHDVAVDGRCDVGVAAIAISRATAVLSIGVTAELISTPGIRSNALRLRTFGSDKLFDCKRDISWSLRHY